jgi:hypothetical protein
LRKHPVVIVDTGIGATLDLIHKFQQYALPLSSFFILPLPLEEIQQPGGIDKAADVLKDRIIKRGRGESESDLQGRLDTARMWLGQTNQLPFTFIANSDGKQIVAYEKIVRAIKGK